MLDPNYTVGERIWTGYWFNILFSARKNIKGVQRLIDLALWFLIWPLFNQQADNYIISQFVEKQVYLLKLFSMISIMNL